MASFAALTFLLGLGSPGAVALAAGMGVVALIELRGGERLRRFEPAAASMQGFNQLALGAMLTVYGAWGIYASLTGPGPYAHYAAADPQLARALRPVEGITRTITVAVYCTMIAAALAAQGGLAVYYFTRRRHVCAYLAQTPAWVREVRTAAFGAR